MFVLVAAAAHELARYFKWVGLPLISGFLVIGILAGPFVLDLFPPQVHALLALLDKAALAFIALAAGGELHLSEVRGQLRSILTIIGSQVIFVFLIGVAAFLLLAPYIPFLQGMTPGGVWAVGVLSAAIMVARSPSSAFAIIKELRASGPFTQRVLGVTVLKDAVVIIVFALSISAAAILLEGMAFSGFSILVIALEVVLDMAVGALLGLLLHSLFSLRLPESVQSAAMLALGFLVFVAADALHDVHMGPFRLFTEPLLICMVAGFGVANLSRYRQAFQAAVERIAPLIFVVFFVSVGVALRLDVLQQSWAIVLALVLVRGVAVYVGSFVGGALSGGRLNENLIMGLTFLTQAGVSVGLAEEVAVEFPGWGEAFATLVIGSIVVNQIIGPPLMKWAVQWVGEAHVGDDQVENAQSALIFGANAEMITLARELLAHHWEVKVVNMAPENTPAPDNVEISRLEEISPAAFRALGVDHYANFIFMCGDDDLNERLARIAYEEAPQARLIARVDEPSRLARFRDLEAITINPTTSYMQLLSTVVRAPAAVTAVLLGEDMQRDIVEVTVRARQLDGLPLRDLSLPPSVLVLSLRRGEQMLVPHGHTRLHRGDRVTLFGDVDELEDASAYFRLGAYTAPVERD